MQVGSWISHIYRSTLDLVFPPQCVGCGRVGVMWCEACREEVPHAIREGIPRPKGIKGIRAAAVFEGSIREVIHALKYEGGTSFATPLADLIAMRVHFGRGKPDAILPVPLHPTRQAQRGYNQSALVGRRLAEIWHIPFSDALLIRERDTPSQVGLNNRERQQNVRGAFRASKALNHRRVLLIDDVCTTGATLGACAEACLAAGARGVWAVIIAHARPQKNKSEAHLS
jgi:ComF family protein